jgi:hypothetical protein
MSHAMDNDESWRQEYEPSRASADCWDARARRFFPVVALVVIGAIAAGVASLLVDGMVVVVVAAITVVVVAAGYGLAELLVRLRVRCNHRRELAAQAEFKAKRLEGAIREENARILVAQLRLSAGSDVADGPTDVAA